MDESPDYIDRITESQDMQSEAWTRTLDDMESLAEARREEGWDVSTFMTGHTAPVSRDDNENSDRFGLVTVLPDNYAEEFRQMYEEHSLDQYQVYSSEVEGFVYLVLEVLDFDSRTSVMLALQYDRVLARGMLASAYDEDTMFTYVQRIDGTELGVFQHDEYEPLLPKGSKPPADPDE